MWYDSLPMSVESTSRSVCCWRISSAAVVMTPPGNGCLATSGRHGYGWWRTLSRSWYVVAAAMCNTSTGRWRLSTDCSFSRWELVCTETISSVNAILVGNDRALSHHKPRPWIGSVLNPEPQIDMCVYRNKAELCPCESESEFLYSVLLWNNHFPICYRHRQSGSTAYGLQARPAPTGPGLWLTAIPRHNLPFIGVR